MAYTKTTWRTGDVITAEKLNNVEQGIAQNAHDIEDLSEAIEGVEERVTESTDDIDQLKSNLIDLGLSVEGGVLCVEFGEDEELEG